MQKEDSFSVNTLSRPVKRDKQENFEKACTAMKNDVELFAVSEFHKFMSEIAKESDLWLLRHNLIREWIHFIVSSCVSKYKS